VVTIIFVKIELIVPPVEENARVPNLALPILAGLSPTDVQISFTDDLLTPIDLGKDLNDVDLVGITVLSKTALRAYEIGDAYRKKGIPVVLGGIHPTALPEEAIEHADSVVLWEAEEIWPRLIEDARTRNLKPFYRQEGYTELSKMPMPRRDILPQRGLTPHFLPIKMSAETLRQGWKKAWKEFYSFPSIWKRFHWEYSPTLINRIGYFPFQLMQHRFTKKKILEGRRRFRTR
jgi:radical SAM superfamily enzyme YgiQ (UPF0313 family)